jgi:hypothetical protein
MFIAKSGSQLLFESVKMSLDIHRIKYETEDRRHTKKIIFVRNPIDRFFSGYFWMLHMSKQNPGGEDQAILDREGITTLSAYIRRYSEFTQRANNPHYIPQSQDLLNETEIKDYGQAYEKRFRAGYSLVRIEDVGNAIHNTHKDNLRDISLPSVFLWFPKEVSMSFFLAYHHEKGIFENGHHLHSEWKYLITEEEYLTVKSFFQREMAFFGYTHEPNPSLKFKSQPLI